jgi:hypothetical protein
MVMFMPQSHKLIICIRNKMTVKDPKIILFLCVGAIPAKLVATAPPNKMAIK